MNVEFTVAAWNEVREAMAYYDAQRPGLGDEFVAEVWHGVGRISDFPNAWQQLDEGIRRYRLNRFPYGLVYEVQPDHALILAVMHLSRKPGYWTDR